MNTWVGDGVEPMAELRVEIIEIAEQAAEEEVLHGCTGTVTLLCPWFWAE